MVDHLPERVGVVAHRGMAWQMSYSPCIDVFDHLRDLSAQVHFVETGAVAAWTQPNGRQCGPQDTQFAGKADQLRPPFGVEVVGYRCRQLFGGKQLRGIAFPSAVR